MSASLVPPALLPNLQQLRQAAFDVAGPLFTTFDQVRNHPAIRSAYARVSLACNCLVRLEADAALPMGGIYGYFDPTDRSVHVPVSFVPPAGIVGELPLLLHELQHAQQLCGIGSIFPDQCAKELNAERVAAEVAIMPHYEQFLGNAPVDEFICALIF